MKNISIEEKVLAEVNKVMNQEDAEVAIILSLKTVVKLHRIAKADWIEVTFLDEDGSWADCLIIQDASCRNRRFITKMICSVDF